MTPTMLLPDSLLMAKENQPPTLTARVATELIRQAHVICAHANGANSRQLKMTALFDAILRPTLTSMYDEVMARLAKNPASEITLDELLDVAARRLSQMQSHRPKSRRSAE